MGAHLYVRAPLHSARFLLLLLLVFSTIHRAKGSDSAALIEFKDSLSNGNKLISWMANKSPCNNDTANWEGIVCTNGTVWGIHLEKKALEGYIDMNILSKLPSLMSISFNNNNFKGTFPDFGMLDGMQEISLANNKFSSEIPSNAFKGMKWLEKLDLANNELVGQIPSSLTRLPELKELMLQDNDFEGEIPKFAPGKLKVANFANNHLRGHIPEVLQHFPFS